jgi:hypothetical protein
VTDADWWASVVQACIAREDMAPESRVGDPQGHGGINLPAISTRRPSSIRARAEFQED